MRLPWIKKKSRLIFHGHICRKYPPAIKRARHTCCQRTIAKKLFRRLDLKKKKKTDRSFRHNEDYLERCSTDATKS